MRCSRCANSISRPCSAACSVRVRLDERVRAAGGHPRAAPASACCTRSWPSAMPELVPVLPDARRLPARSSPSRRGRETPCGRRRAVVRDALRAEVARARRTSSSPVTICRYCTSAVRDHRLIADRRGRRLGSMTESSTTGSTAPRSPARPPAPPPSTTPPRAPSRARCASRRTADVDAAVAAAKAAFPAWADDVARPSASRCMFAFRELLNARKEELAAILTNEHGKVTSDALGEIARGLEVVEFACGIPHLMKGEYSENVSTGVDVYSIKQPLGVVGIISPFNFPAMVPLWFFPIAIAAGNTVVLKPSEKDPSAAIWMAELLKEAGLPDGVLQRRARRQGGGRRPARRTPTSQSISFVGSTPDREVHLRDRRRATASACRPSAARRTTCSCCPTPTSTSSPTRRSTPASARRASAAWRSRSSSRSSRSPTSSSPRSPSAWPALKVGDGTRGCDMGPLITKEHRDKVAGYLDVADDGRRRRSSSTAAASRSTATPTASGSARPSSTRCRRHPRVYTRRDLRPGALGRARRRPTTRASRSSTASQYGNGTAIFTNDGGAARRFQHEVTVGMVGINVPIPVPVGYYSFGGWKDSLFGDTKAYGPQRDPLLHAREGDHAPLARPAPRRHQPGLPRRTADRRRRLLASESGQGATGWMRGSR